MCTYTHIYMKLTEKHYKYSYFSTSVLESSIKLTTNNEHWTDWRIQTAAKMHKAAGQINSLSGNMNLFAQTPLKVEPAPRLSKRTPQIHPTNLQMKSVCTRLIWSN